MFINLSLLCDLMLPRKFQLGLNMSTGDYVELDDATASNLNDTSFILIPEFDMGTCISEYLDASDNGRFFKKKQEIAQQLQGTKGSAYEKNFYKLHDKYKLNIYDWLEFMDAKILTDAKKWCEENNVPYSEKKHKLDPIADRKKLLSFLNKQGYPQEWW